MKDILITENNDIELLDGDIPLIDGNERVIQQIKTGLFILPFTWILDYRVGVDYISGLREYPRIMFAQVKNAIKRVWGVDNVLKFQANIDREQIYNISANVKIGNSEIPINEVLNYGNQ